FRLIQCLVSHHKQLIRIACLRWKMSSAKRNGNDLFQMIFAFLHRYSDTFSRFKYVALCCEGKKHHELFSSITAAHSDCSYRLPHNFSKMLQNSVSLLMAISIVNGFEAIDIQYDNGIWFI